MDRPASLDADMHEAGAAVERMRPTLRSRLRLPDFLGVGPPRTGTTWLNAVLTGHVGLPYLKETQFFRSRYSLGIEWYASHFERHPAELPVGEWGPGYFAPEQIRERIKLHLPDCRIICTLRHPVDRMYSHYKLLNSMATIKGTFEDLACYHPALIDFARYSYHLRGWQQQFGRENVLVLIHEDSYRDRQAYIDRLCEFIGIPRIDISQVRWIEKPIHTYASAPRSRKMTRRLFRLQSELTDRGKYRMIKLLRPVIGFWKQGGKQYPPLDPGLKEKLRSFLSAEIEGLEELIQRDLSVWK